MNTPDGSEPIRFREVVAFLVWLALVTAAYFALIGLPDERGYWTGYLLCTGPGFLWRPGLIYLGVTWAFWLLLRIAMARESGKKVSHKILIFVLLISVGSLFAEILNNDRQFTHGVAELREILAQVL